MRQIRTKLNTNKILKIFFDKYWLQGLIIIVLLYKPTAWQGNNSLRILFLDNTIYRDSKKEFGDIVPHEESKGATD